MVVNHPSQRLGKNVIRGFILRVPNSLLNNAKQKLCYLFCIVFGFHYLCYREDRRRFGNENKKLRLLFCISLTLHYLCIKIAKLIKTSKKDG